MEIGIWCLVILLSSRSKRHLSVGKDLLDIPNCKNQTFILFFRKLFGSRIVNENHLLISQKIQNWSKPILLSVKNCLLRKIRQSVSMENLDMRCIQEKQSQTFLHKHIAEQGSINLQNFINCNEIFLQRSDIPTMHRKIICKHLNL